MKKKTIEFSHKVKGDYSPVGLQKVFFSHAKENIDLIHVIAEDIWKTIDCAIYYHEESSISSNIDLTDFEQKLSEMKLFVVLVTTKYLTKHNIAKDIEFGYAIKNHIPIIPIAMEPGIEEVFANEMNAVCQGYGDIQLLKYHVTDPSELSYRDRLSREIRSILFDSMDVDRIKKAFTSRVFLSY